MSLNLMFMPIRFGIVYSQPLSYETQKLQIDRPQLGF